MLNFALPMAAGGAFQQTSGYGERQMKLVVKVHPLEADGQAKTIEVPPNVANYGYSAQTCDGKPVVVTTYLELSDDEQREAKAQQQRAALGFGAAPNGPQRLS